MLFFWFAGFFATVASLLADDKSLSKVTVALLGSDRDGTDKSITLDVKKLASELDVSRVRILYTGGGSGLRHSFVKEFKLKGGEVIAYNVSSEKGSTPEEYSCKLLQNDAERLEQLYKDSDLYLVLPGGMETISEVSYVIDQNAAKEGLLKPIIVFDAHNYYQRFFQFIGYVEKEGFMDHKRLFRRSVKEVPSISNVLSQIYYAHNQRAAEISLARTLAAPL